jgi:putative phosphoesterase
MGARGGIVGVISDTHGLVREEALVALSGVSLIVHAGDVGGAHVVAALERIAPVVAVRGNNDQDGWGRRLPQRATVEFGGARVLVIHDPKEIGCDPAREGFDVVVSGHSHRPGVERRDGVLYLNPGSAGPRRFSLPVTVARLSVCGGRARARIVALRGASPSARARGRAGGVSDRAQAI